MSREDILNKPYLNRTDIKMLLDVPRQVAENIFLQADAIDNEMDFRVYPTKVRMQSVLKVTNISWNLLQKQIKNADAIAQQSAE